MKYALMRLWWWLRAPFVWAEENGKRTRFGFLWFALVFFSYFWIVVFIVTWYAYFAYYVPWMQWPFRIIGWLWWLVMEAPFPPNPYEWGQ